MPRLRGAAQSYQRPVLKGVAFRPFLSGTAQLQQSCEQERNGLWADAYSPEADWEIRGEPLPCRLAADQHPQIPVARYIPPRSLDTFALKYGEDTAGISQIAPTESSATEHG